VGLNDRDTDVSTAATRDSEMTQPQTQLTPLQVTMTLQGEIEKSQTQITSADCNAVMSTRSRDTDRSAMDSLKSRTLLTSSEQPPTHLSESVSYDLQDLIFSATHNRLTVTASFAE